MKMLFSAYRLDQYADPDGFMVQAASVLNEYSDAVVSYVTNPKTGIQRRQKWPPTVFEIGEACDAAAKIVKGRQFLAEREARGFFWSDNRSVFINEEGERYNPAMHSKKRTKTT